MKNTNLLTPSSNCTPVSIIKSKRLRVTEKHTETQVTIQFFTPNVREKENSIASSHKTSPVMFMAKSFHNTGFTPRNLVSSLNEKLKEHDNK